MVQAKHIHWDSYAPGPGFIKQLNDFFQQEQLGKDDIVKIAVNHSEDGDISATIFYDKN